VDASLEPGLPRVLADRTRLAEALTLLTREAASTVGPERPLTVVTARDSGSVTITIGPPSAQLSNGSTSGEERGAVAEAHAEGSSRDIGDEVLATRLVLVQGGSLEKTPSGMVVRVGGEARA
jgi:hypothetical protein